MSDTKVHLRDGHDPADTAPQPGPVGGEPLDRRVRRSRRALHAALVELATEKGYDSVTIDDLTTRADMARRTFYAHYVDKDDLLKAIVTDLLDDLIERVTAIMPVDMRDAQGRVIHEMFSHGQAHRDVYRMVLAGAGNGMGLRMLANTMSKTAQVVFASQHEELGVSPRLPIDFVARAFVGQHLTLLRWWLDNHTGYSLEQLAAMRLALMVRGEAWALGFDSDDFPAAAGDERLPAPVQP
jgi:AcrR family transcriptional regulator